jgi:hypothetical protein
MLSRGLYVTPAGGLIGLKGKTVEVGPWYGPLCDSMARLWSHRRPLFPGSIVSNLRNLWKHAVTPKPFEYLLFMGNDHNA